MESTARHAGGRPRKEVDANELKRLLAEGRSLRQIASELGRGYGSVHRAAKALVHGTSDPKTLQATRSDSLYGTPAGDYPDKAERFALFSRSSPQLNLRKETSHEGKKSRPVTWQTQHR